MNNKLKLLFIYVVCLVLFSACSFSNSKKNKELRIGIDGLESLELWGKEGNIVAFLQELMNDMPGFNEYKIRFYNFMNNRALEDFKEGRLDGFFSASMPPKSLPILKSNLCMPAGNVIVVASEFPYTSYDEIKNIRGLRIGLDRNYSSQFISDLGLDWVVVNYSGKKHKIDDLVAGSVDLVLLPLIPAYSLSQGFYFSEIRSIPYLLDDLGIHLLMGQNDASIVAQFNEGLKQMKNSGKFYELATKWNLFNLEFDND